MDRILEQSDTLFKLFEYSAARWHGRPMASYIDGTQAYTYGSFQEKVLKMSVLLAPITRTPPARQRQSGRGRFYIRGRLNNVILGATGENIYPEEIEFVINSYPGVGESILEYVNKRVNKQSALARIEMLTEPFKKTATQKIRRFLYMSPSHA